MLPTMDEYDFRNKTVIVRIDINSPLDPSTREILDTWRMKKVVPTLQELQGQRARQVLLAHQGRPGKWDFTGLAKHADELSRLTGMDIQFVNDVYGERAQRAVDNLQPGEILLLDNVRKCEEELEKKSAEEHAHAAMIRTLAPRADAFVNDAFAAAHRKQCSLMGFIPVLPSFAGRLMQKEVEMVEMLRKRAERPRLFIFGGGKYENALDVMETLLRDGTADKIMLGGMPANAFLAALGRYDMEVDVRVKRMLETYGERLIIPSSTRDGKDIGEESIERFREEIGNAASIFISGPMGVFEEERYRRGTEEVLRAIAASSAFSMAGGGHTVAAITMLGFENAFSYISTGGGALERMLVGERLPVIEALIKFKR